MHFRNFRSRPSWSIKDYWVYMREDGYRGVGNPRWWRGGVKWGDGVRMQQIIKKMDRDMQSISKQVDTKPT